MEHTTSSPLTHHLVDQHPAVNIDVGGISLRRSNSQNSNHNNSNNNATINNHNIHSAEHSHRSDFSDSSSSQGPPNGRKSSLSYLSTSMMLNYALCINLDLAQYRFMLSLVFLMYVFYFIIEVFHVVDVGDQLSSTPSAILAIVATVFTAFILGCIAKLIYIPTRNTALLSSATILFLQLIFIVQTVLYYHEVHATPGYVISTIVVMTLQILSAMLLYRYWEYVTFYYAGGPDGTVDLRAIVADISMNNSSASFNYNAHPGYSKEKRILTPTPGSNGSHSSDANNDNNNSHNEGYAPMDVPPSEIKPRQISTSQHSLNVSERITLSQQSNLGNNNNNNNSSSSSNVDPFNNEINHTHTRPRPSATHEEILTSAFQQQPATPERRKEKADIES